MKNGLISLGTRKALTSQRLLELAGIGAFLALMALLGFYTVAGLLDLGPHAWWIAAGVTGAGYLAADFASGFVHFLADNFGSPDTPLLGPVFVRPFRDHHFDPAGITRHDFVEVNGNNCLFSIPLLAGLYALLPDRPGWWELTAAWFWLVLFAAMFVTNQIHKWAHEASPPGWVAKLQAWGIVLSPENHRIHHAAPYDTYYCITWGVLNPLFERIQFFEKLRKVIRLALPSSRHVALPNSVRVLKQERLPI